MGYFCEPVANNQQILVTAAFLIILKSTSIATDFSAGVAEKSCRFEHSHVVGYDFLHK